MSFFSKFFKFKTKELEAKLQPVPDCPFGGYAEIELSWFSNGSVTAELELKHSSVPDGTPVEFFADNRRIATTQTSNGFAKMYETLDASSFTVSKGSQGELRMHKAA